MGGFKEGEIQITERDGERAERQQGTIKKKRVKKKRGSLASQRRKEAVACGSAFPHSPLCYSATTPTLFPPLPPPRIHENSRLRPDWAASPQGERPGERLTAFDLALPGSLGISINNGTSTFPHILRTIQYYFLSS